ncbi:hypothetical protein [Lonepinella sp. BR2271]|uniref:hypothetical protein n=1 Tax=Lonepinella sp. BR2271 TaxID=3434550 RepID=UPI003F6DFD03
MATSHTHIPQDVPIYLAQALHFPTHISQVTVRQVGSNCIISPTSQIWDSFFLSGDSVSDDFMAERLSVAASQRESFD